MRKETKLNCQLYRQWIKSSKYFCIICKEDKGCKITVVTLPMLNKSSLKLLQILFNFLSRLICFDWMFNFKFASLNLVLPMIMFFGCGEHDGNYVGCKVCNYSTPRDTTETPKVIIGNPRQMIGGNYVALMPLGKVYCWQRIMRWPQIT